MIVRRRPWYSIDPVHFEWLHGNWSRALRGIEGQRPPTHLRIAFDEFEYGFAYRRILEGQSEKDELWTVGRSCLWPNCLFTGGHFEWRVPVDDTNTLSVGWFFDRVPTEMEPCTQDHIPYWYGPTKDPRTGRWITTHVMNQDFVAWTSQGAVEGRDPRPGAEHLRATADHRPGVLRQWVFPSRREHAAWRDSWTGPGP